MELCVTFVAHAFFLFFRDFWRLFDTCIVVMGLFDATHISSLAINQIRAVRVLRAMRLLKKSKSLAPIVQALFASVQPVLSSMVLLVDI